MLVRSMDAIYHVPVTWRFHPLNDGTLIEALQHSGSGTRCCYDVQIDLVYLDELMRMIQEESSDVNTVEAGKDAPCPKNVGVLSGGLMAGETSEYPYVAHKLSRAPISDAVSRPMS